MLGEDQDLILDRLVRHQLTGPRSRLPGTCHAQWCSAPGWQSKGHEPAWTDTPPAQLSSHTSIMIMIREERDLGPQRSIWERGGEVVKTQQQWQSDLLAVPHSPSHLLDYSLHENQRCVAAVSETSKSKGMACVTYSQCRIFS